MEEDRECAGVYSNGEINAEANADQKSTRR
jgi:hypothetical protein